MTDIHNLSDTDLNERIVKAKGYTFGHPRSNLPECWYKTLPDGWTESLPELPDFVNSWDLAGGLLEEMGEGVSLEHSKYYHEWGILLSDNDFFSVIADTPQRAIAEAWLEWNEGK